MRDWVRRRSCKRRQACVRESVCEGTLKKTDSGLHITRDTRVSIYPPRSSQASLSVEQPKLVEAQFLLQTTAQSDPRFPSTDDEDRIECIRILFIAVDHMDRIG